MIEAESEDEAADIFRDGDGIFDFLEVYPAQEDTPAEPEADDIPY